MKVAVGHPELHIEEIAKVHRLHDEPHDPA